MSAAAVAQRDNMKKFLVQSFKTDNIAEIDPTELRNKMEGAHLLNRIQHRK